jgi:hypothetical protein
VIESRLRGLEASKIPKEKFTEDENPVLDLGLMIYLPSPPKKAFGLPSVSI